MIGELWLSQLTHSKFSLQCQLVLLATDTDFNLLVFFLPNHC